MKQISTVLVIIITFVTSGACFSQPSSFMNGYYTGSPAPETLRAVAENDSGNFVSAGSFLSTTAGFTVLILEMTPAGQITNMKSFPLGFSNSISVESIVATSDGHYLVTGTVLNTGQSDWLVMKIDPALDLVWAKTFGSVNAGNDRVNNGFEISSGRYMVTGVINNLTGNNNIALMILDASGNIESVSFYDPGEPASPGFRTKYLGDGHVALLGMQNAISIADTTGTIVKNATVSLGNGNDRTVSVIRNTADLYVLLSIYQNTSGFSQVGIGVMDTALSNLGLNFSLTSNQFADHIVHDIVQYGPDDYYVSGVVDGSTAGPVAMVIRSQLSVGLSASAFTFPSQGWTGPAMSRSHDLVLTDDEGIFMVGESGDGQIVMMVSFIDSTMNNSCIGGFYPMTSGARASISATVPQPATDSIIDFGTLNLQSYQFQIPSATCMPLSITDAGQVTVPFSIAPTLVAEGFRVFFSEDLPLTDATLLLHDITGRLIRKEVVFDRQKIDCSGLENGLYHVTLIDDDSGIRTSEKVIKVR